MSLRAPGPAPRARSVVTPSCGTAAHRCEIGDALRLMAKAHVIDLLHLLSTRGPLRFGELRREVRVNANVLSLRLKDLVDAGLVLRREEPGATLHVEYSATDAGRALIDAMEPLRRWGAQQAAPLSREGTRAAAPI